MKLEIISRADLLDTIPHGFNKDRDVRLNVLDTYLLELAYMVEISQKAEKSGHEVEVVFQGFFDMTAFFSVTATDIPEKDEYNFYGHNTSQWIYAGCIQVTKEGKVSSHH